MSLVQKPSHALHLQVKRLERIKQPDLSAPETLSEINHLTYYISQCSLILLSSFPCSMDFNSNKINTALKRPATRKFLFVQIQATLSGLKIVSDIKSWINVQNRTADRYCETQKYRELPIYILPPK